MKIILRIVSKLASALLQALVSVLRLHHCATSDPDGPDQRHLRSKHPRVPNPLRWARGHGTYYVSRKAAVMHIFLNKRAISRQLHVRQC